MKTSIKILLLLFVSTLLFIQCEKEEPETSVEIPDVNFLDALIALGIDTDGDGKICTCEAEAVSYLDVSGKQISDMTGIEKFIYLDTLDCQDNRLTSLDLSSNTGLKFLDCTYNFLNTLNVSSNSALLVLDCRINELSSLDVSSNTALEYLWCGYNRLTVIDVTDNTLLKGLECSWMFEQISSLDLSNNVALDFIYCEHSEITTIDVSHQPDLIELICGGNLLSTCDVSGNPALEWLYLDNMPSLGEVCVWTTPFPPEGCNIDTTDSPNVYFTTECSK
jgi:Leucine-rich repeat (LRR) protein